MVQPPRFSHFEHRLINKNGIKGADFVKGETWAVGQSLDAPDCRYARLRARRATSGEVTLIVVDKPEEDHCSLMCLATEKPATRVLRV